METQIKNPEEGKPSPKRKRCVLCAFASATLVGLVIGAISVALLYHLTSDDLCLTAECIHTASVVLNAMDLTVKPCNNFYQFACGNFLASKTIPPDNTAVDTFSIVSDTLQDRLRVLVEEIRPIFARKHFRLVSELYMACTNKTWIDKLGSSPISEIAETLGGWPVVKGESWNANNTWTWQETVQKFCKLGFSLDYILSFSIHYNLRNTTRHILNIDQSVLGISRAFLVKGTTNLSVDSYYRYMTDLAIMLGAEKVDALWELIQSLEFEMNLARISLPKEERRNHSALYNLRSVGQLQANYPYIRWKEYINSLLPDGINVDDDELINVSVPSFFEKLGPLLAKTPNRVIANYMMWRIHMFSASHLSDEFKKRQLQFALKLRARTELEPRWKMCINIVTSSFPIPVGSLYVRKYFQKDAKHIALEMVNDIKNAFGSILGDIDWMDKRTKQFALEKLNSMRTYVGYPDDLVDDLKLAEFYWKFQFDSSKYFESFLKIKAYTREKSFFLLGFPVNKTHWTRHARPAVVNAYYSWYENSIQFPAGILQGKFFHPQRPKYMNYGAIGSIIGHEITHGFDDQGSQFDSSGNLVDWWQKDTKAVYLNKARCIIGQYNNFTDASSGRHLNGINTQGENIADNGGIKQAYIAYLRWTAKHGVEPKLPGLDFSPTQLFWIATAQNWCTKQTQESLEMDITVDNHSPGKYRVLGPLKNMKEFANDFQCPEGSYMHPESKCEVW